MKQLHVLFVCEYYPPHIGGVETFFYELRKALVKRGHRVDVVTSAQPGAPRVEKDEGGVIYRVAVPRVVDRYAFAALALPRVMIASRKVDIIHCTTYTSIPPAWLASKILRKKTVLSVHEVLGQDFVRFAGGSVLTGSILGIFERGLLRFRFDKTVAVSKSTQRRLPRRHKVRSTVIYHGIDEIFSPGSAVSFGAGREKTFLFYGRTASQKGLWFLLDSLPEFFKNERMRDGFKFRLIISGPESERENVRVFLRNHGLVGVVSVEAGVVRSALPDAIRGAYCVVVPSFAEGFGFAAAEACACGVPVVSSDAGSLPEVIGGKHLFFRAGNSESLHVALQAAANGKWEISEVRNFKWEDAAEEFEKLYLELI